MRSEDRRSELLERAYRRGYALRRRRRSAGTLAALTTIAIVVAGAASLLGGNGTHKVSVVETPTTAQPSCAAPLAVPATDVPRDVAAWAGGAPVIGEGALWTIVSATHVAPNVYDGAYHLKFPWYTRPNGPPLINARRLDGPGTFHADVNKATDARGDWDVSSLDFSGAGCWEVTARYESSTLRFRLRISALPSSVVFENATDGVGLDFTCNVPAAGDPVCSFDLLSSQDAGRTWIRVGGERGITYPGWRGYPDIRIAASGSNVWVYGTRTFESHDGGRTFQAARFHGLVSALVPQADDVWVATRACALCPTNTLVSAPIAGGPWTPIGGFPDLADPYAELVRPSATVAYVVGNDTHTVLYRTENAGRSWQSRALPPPPPASTRTNTVTLAALGSDQVWMLNGGSAPARDQEKALYRSDDGGRQWTLLADTGSPQPSAGHLPKRGLALVLTVVTPQRIWIPLDRGPFVGSFDGAAHWFDTAIIDYVEQVTFVDPRHGWAWNAGGYQTTDGKNWVPVA